MSIFEFFIVFTAFVANPLYKFAPILQNKCAHL